MVINEKMLRKLQLTELELLLEVDRICRKHKIQYGLTGGTLLGAVRHGGFIPWDDDADIAMPRNEYERFKEVCRKELDSKRFYFQDHTNTEGYRWGYGKLRKKNTKFIRENQEHMPYEQGVFIDIFPRDGVPDSVFLRKIHTICCFCIRKLLWSAVGRVSSCKIKKIWYGMLYRIPAERIWRIYDWLVTWSNMYNTKYIRTLTFPLPNNLPGYEREGSDGKKQIEFEGHKFMMDSNYKMWLKKEFGDYRELPPLDRRKSHPVSEIKL